MHRRRHGRSRHLRAHVARAALGVSLAAIAIAGCERAPKKDLPTALRHDDPEADKEQALQERFACLDEATDVDPRYEPVVRALCSDLHHLHGVGVSLAIAEKGELRFDIALGKACADQDRPVTADALFRIGSITKTLTATAALVAAQRGRVSLDHPLPEYLPDFTVAEPGRARAITLRHLLDHTSGLPELGPVDTAGLSPDAWYTAWGTRPTWAAPGRVWHYSNSGYALAGTILERALGQPFPRVVEELVLEPMSLAEIDFDAQAAARERTAVCGHPGRSEARTVLDVESDFDPKAAGGWATPAGAGLASARGLARFGLGLLEEDGVLEPQSRRAMFDADTPTHTGDAQTYGLGLARRELANGVVVLRHAGNTGDFAADLYIVPDKGFVLAILSNTSAHYRATAESVFTQRLGVSLTPMHPAGSHEPAAYAGDYTVPGWPDPVRVTRAADGSLRLASTQLRIDNVELRPGPGDTFQVTWPALGLSERISFVFDEDAKTVWIRGPRFLGHRLTD